jgi:hypothetical protein
MSDPSSTGELVLYQTGEGVRFFSRFVDGQVWLTQSAIADLYGTSPQNVSMHLDTIYNEGEVSQGATCKDFLQVR